MSDSFTKKIIEFFNKINCPAEYILKNKYENPTGIDLACEEINLPEYAIIHGGADISLNNSIKKSKFEKENKINISCFYRKYCNSLEGLLEEFKSEGYEIIHQIKI